MGSLPGPTPLRALWRAADPLLPPTRIALTAAALGPAQTMVGEQAVPQPPLAVAGPRVTVALVHAMVHAHKARCGQGKTQNRKVRRYGLLK